MRDNSQRAQLAAYLLWAMLGLEILTILSGYMQYRLLTRLSYDEYVSDAALNFNDTREMIVGILYTLTYIVSIVMFIRWFRRAYYNLHQKVAYLDFDEGWAAGSWFVPFLNLYRPFSIMRELYNETSTILKRNLDGYQRKSTMIVGIWWTVWIISNIIDNIIFRSTFSLDVSTIDELMTMTTSGIFSAVLGIPTALLAIKVVKDYSLMEDKLYALETEGTANRFDDLAGYDDILDAPID
ncbi:MAG: DUF4328 domain-containing protein [Bacteroidota bacterium]